ncbi:MAG TPA: phosphoadenylyl-sulfate reductase [Bacteroidales bacterium]|nr:phosphoadenylyl-sulfate reductase [Bacteroidales bacterium]HRX98390.1 phosphoadenylyl-sulfate reductase [Bacteroidales bacterium]
MKDDLIRELNDRFAESTVEEVLQYFLKEYKGRIAFASSLGAEDQVLTHMIREIAPDTKIFTLDTGRMFQETYDLIDRTNARYKMKMEIYFPDYKQVENMVNEKGMNLFYESVENRKLCCHIRKIEPLHRALEGCDIWITGLRKEQSVTRNNNNLLELDENNHGRLKLNPLINWSEDEVWAFINKHKIPYNTLHDQGFPSIGCLPCTRAVQPGEDVRAGRWWWETPEHKECGLHQK